MGEQIVVPKDSFQIKKYNIIGVEFDSLVTNNRKEQMKLLYNLLRKQLMKKYPEAFLKTKLKSEEMIVARGLVVDLTSGNVIRPTNSGKTATVMHGSNFLTIREILQKYRKYKLKRLVDFVRNPMETLATEDLVVLCDFVGAVVAAIFARLVDTIDKFTFPKKSYKQAYADLQAELENVLYQDGGYFNTVLKTPEVFFKRDKKKQYKFFKRLRKNKRATFLISQWRPDITYKIGERCMGPNWVNGFDRIICNVDKYDFYRNNTPLRKLEYGILGASPFTNNFYCNGNWDELEGSLKSVNKIKSAKVLYIGSDLMLDVYLPKITTTCDTIAICEELEVEGAYGYKRGHRDLVFLFSSKWGSFFNTILNEPTFWIDVLLECSKFCVPRLNCITKHAIDYDYSKMKIKK